MKAALLCAGIAMSGFAWAQSPSTGEQAARARMLLASPHLSDKAWAAFYIGRFGLKDLYPALIDEFRTATAMASAPGEENRGYMAALFDAAIQAGLEIPVDTLQPFEERWGDSVLILLANPRLPDRQSALLRFEDSPGDLYWVAANNLMLGAKSQQWYSHVLSQLHLQHHFTISDPGYGKGIRDGVGRGGACGDALIQFPDSFPPIDVYSLEARPQAGLVLIAAGPEDVYYRRSRIEPGKGGGFGSCFTVNREQMRVRYLASLAGKSESETESIARAATTIVYRDDAQFLKDTQAALDQQERGLRSLLGNIETRTRLHSTGAALRIEPDFDDQRHGRAVPLPPVAARSINR